MMRLYRIGILLRAHQWAIGLSGGLMTLGEWLAGGESAPIGSLAVFNLILAMAGVLDGHYRRIFNPLTMTNSLLKASISWTLRSLMMKKSNLNNRTKKPPEGGSFFYLIFAK